MLPEPVCPNSRPPEPRHVIGRRASALTIRHGALVDGGGEPLEIGLGGVE